MFGHDLWPAAGGAGNIYGGASSREQGTPKRHHDIIIAVSSRVCWFQTKQYKAVQA
jgi:hypothetical protein